MATLTALAAPRVKVVTWVAGGLALAFCVMQFIRPGLTNFHGTDPRAAVRLRLIKRFLLAVALASGICGCAGEQPNVSASMNQSASLVGELPANPLGWKVITSNINRSLSTMSVLYNVHLAVLYARTHSKPKLSERCDPVIRDVERAQSPRAEIPCQVKSVEYVFVHAAADAPSHSYQRYEGAPVKSSAERSPDMDGRAAYTFSLRATVMP
jgi:hypothetical protein